MELLFYIYLIPQDVIQAAPAYQKFCFKVLGSSCFLYNVGIKLDGNVSEMSLSI